MSSARSDCAAQGRPKIAGRVGVDLDRQRLELLPEPGARLDPFRREGDALRAVLIGGEAAQFLEFGDRPLGVEGTVHGFGEPAMGFASTVTTKPRPVKKVPPALSATRLLQESKNLTVRQLRPFVPGSPPSTLDSQPSTFHLASHSTST